MDYRDITATIAEVARNYHYEKTPGIIIKLQDLIEKILRYVHDLLSSFRIFVPGMADTRAVGNVMQVIVFIVAALAVLGIIYAVYRRMTQLNAQSLLAKKGQSYSETMLDASGWLAQAEQLAGKKEWKEACRALYFSLLRNMSEKGILDFVPTRTNYEYWYALSKHRSVAVLFRQIADIVEVSWFGYHQASQTDYDQCLRLLKEAEEELQAAKVPAA